MAAAVFGALRPGGAFVFTAERSEPDGAPSGYRIHPHGRYSHTERYLRTVLASAGFEAARVRAIRGGRARHAAQLVCSVAWSGSPHTEQPPLPRNSIDFQQSGQKL